MHQAQIRHAWREEHARQRGGQAADDIGADGGLQHRRGMRRGEQRAGIAHADEGAERQQVQQEAQQHEGQALQHRQRAGEASPAQHVLHRHGLAVLRRHAFQRRAVQLLPRGRRGGDPVARRVGRLHGRVHPGSGGAVRRLGRAPFLRAPFLRTRCLRTRHLRTGCERRNAGHRPAQQAPQRPFGKAGHHQHQRQPPGRIEGARPQLGVLRRAQGKGPDARQIAQHAAEADELAGQAGHPGRAVLQQLRAHAVRRQRHRRSRLGRVHHRCCLLQRLERGGERRALLRIVQKVNHLLRLRWRQRWRGWRPDGRRGDGRRRMRQDQGRGLRPGLRQSGVRQPCQQHRRRHKPNAGVHKPEPGLMCER